MLHTEKKRVSGENQKKPNMLILKKFSYFSCGINDANMDEDG